MLRKWGWVPGALVLAVVGLASFTIPHGTTRNLVSEVTAFAIAALTMALMTASERSPWLRAKVSDLLTVATAGYRADIRVGFALAHSLGALGVQIQAAQAVLTDQADIDRAVELLAQARRMVTEGLVETRRAVHALRVDTPPLDRGLAELGAEHQDRHRAQVNFQVSGTPRSLPPDAGLALTRTAQEALVNTAKHAPYQPVEIRVVYDKGATALTVKNKLCDGPADSGVGGDRNGAANDAGAVGSDDGREASDGTTFETANGGYGLAGMRERLLLLDGTLSARPGRGHLGRRGQGPPVTGPAGPPAPLRVVVADDQEAPRELLGDLPDGLTKREAGILSMMARGMANPDIASELYLSAHTVKSHINRIFAKTGSPDRAAAVRYARQHDLA